MKLAGFAFALVTLGIAAGCASSPASQLAEKDGCAIVYTGVGRTVVSNSFGCLTNSELAVRRREIEENDRYYDRRWRQRQTNAQQSTPYDGDEGVSLAPTQH